MTTEHNQNPQVNFERHYAHGPATNTVRIIPNEHQGFIEVIVAPKDRSTPHPQAFTRMTEFLHENLGSLMDQELPAPTFPTTKKAGQSEPAMGALKVRVNEDADFNSTLQVVNQEVAHTADAVEAATKKWKTAIEKGKSAADTPFDWDNFQEVKDKNGFGAAMAEPHQHKGEVGKRWQEYVDMIHAEDRNATSPIEAPKKEETHTQNGNGKAPQEAKPKHLDYNRMMLNHFFAKKNGAEVTERTR